MSDILVITGPDGEPIGVVDQAQIGADAAKLVRLLTAHCNDPAALDRIAREFVSQGGQESYSYVCTAALRVLVEEVLSPVLDSLAAVTGVDLRDRMKAAEQGEQPGPDGAR